MAEDALIPGFHLEDVAPGDGRPAAPGDRVTVRYRGWVEGGREIDPPDGGRTELTLGRGEVIEGWERGIEGMRVGGVRRLVIPPDLGYRTLGLPELSIPGDAILVFEIELSYLAER